MIYLKNNTINRVVLTLTESSTLSSPNYLFVFENEFQTKPNYNIINFHTPDISTVTSRYNLFDITVASSGSTTGGTNVSLNLTPGQYVYKIYESVNPTLDVNQTTGKVVERGRMIVELTNENKFNTKNIYN